MILMTTDAWVMRNVPTLGASTLSSHNVVEDVSG
jgi:hypothetical protein